MVIMVGRLNLLFFIVLALSPLVIRMLEWLFRPPLKMIIEHRKEKIFRANYSKIPRVETVVKEDDRVAIELEQSIESINKTEMRANMRRNAVILWCLLVGYPVLSQHIFVERNIDVLQMTTRMFLDPLSQGVNGFLRIFHYVFDFQFNLFAPIAMITGVVVVVLNLYIVLIYLYLVAKGVLWLLRKMNLRKTDGLDTLKLPIEKWKDLSGEFVSLFLRASLLTFVLVFLITFSLASVHLGSISFFLPLLPWTLPAVLPVGIPVLMIIIHLCSHSFDEATRKRLEYCLKVSTVFVIVLGSVMLISNMHHEHLYRQKLRAMETELQVELEIFMELIENDFETEQFEAFVSLLIDPDFELENIIILYELAFRQVGMDAHDVVRALSEAFVERLAVEINEYGYGWDEWNETLTRTQLMVFLTLLEPSYENIQVRHFNLDRLGVRGFASSVLIYREAVLNMSSPSQLMGSSCYNISWASHWHHGRRSQILGPFTGWTERERWVARWIFPELFLGGTPVNLEDVSRRTFQDVQPFERFIIDWVSTSANVNTVRSLVMMPTDRQLVDASFSFGATSDYYVLRARVYCELGMAVASVEMPNDIHPFMSVHTQSSLITLAGLRRDGYSFEDVIEELIFNRDGDGNVERIINRRHSVMDGWHWNLREELESIFEDNFLAIEAYFADAELEFTVDTWLYALPIPVVEKIIQIYETQGEN